MKNSLQGNWPELLLQPILVHISIGFWPMVFVFDILSSLGLGGNVMVQLSFYTVLFGLLIALLAVVSGLINWFYLDPKKPAGEIGLYYMLLNIMAVLLWLVNFDLRTGTVLKTTSVSAGSLMLSAVGLLLLLVASYFSGLMIYDYGINIKQLLRPK